MMRLPWFDYRAPETAAEAARILAGEGAHALAIAGGTDLLPNMKRRQQSPRTLVSLRRIDAMKSARIERDAATLGAGLTLSALVADQRVARQCRGLWQAAAQVATVHLRNAATLGGNLCLDTRCNYYNQNHEWRKAIGFCLKRDGETCWVATGSKRCVAVSSTDCAPALIALGARVLLVSAEGEREIELAQLYRNDGIDYLSRRPDEILARVVLPDLRDRRSCYWKLRRRGSFDFPVLGVAASARLAPDGTVEEARVVLGAVASRPVLTDAGGFLAGRRLDDDTIAEAAALVASRAKPMDNTDFDLYWRKHVVAQYVGYALREIRGDDMSEARLRTARQAL